MRMCRTRLGDMVTGVVLAAVVPLGCGSGQQNATSRDGGGSEAGPGGNDAGDANRPVDRRGGGDTGGPSACVPPPPKPQTEPPVKPSGYLHITEDQMAVLMDKVASDAAEWRTLKQNVDQEMNRPDPYRSGPENMALVYLLTKDARYAAAAFRWWTDGPSKEDPRGGSYLEIGNLMSAAAIVLNYCHAALSDAQRKTLVDYLDKWTNELWFNNMGSGWGLADPGNNYHMAFLEGTAHAGYALREVKHPNAQKYIDLVNEKLESPRGVLAYLNKEGEGGDWHEGVNYGQRSKQRLFNALGVVASMGGKNYFQSSPFFDATILYALYSLQPGNQDIYPGGDLARSTTMRVSPYDREYLQMVVYWLRYSPSWATGLWLLDNVVNSYNGSEFNYRAAYFRDVLYRVPYCGVAPDKLPLFYHAKGGGLVHFRSGWDDDATSVSIAGTPNIHQSHAHQDVGSFTIFKRGWLAVDAVTYGSSGLNWGADAHNMIRVVGAERQDGDAPGLVKMQDGGAAGFGYAQVDISNMFRKRNRAKDTNETLLNEYTRELVYVRPDALVVYDRVDPKPMGETYDWRMHFPVMPAAQGNHYVAASPDSAIALTMLVGGTASVMKDADLIEGSSNAWRVQVAPAAKISRFLAVVQVAAGAAAPTPTPSHVPAMGSGSYEGAAWGDQVVMFSAAARGQAPTTPFSFTVPGTEKRTYTLANLSGGYDVALSRAGGATTVTVTAGSGKTASPQGIVHFTE